MPNFLQVGFEVGKIPPRSLSKRYQKIFSFDIGICNVFTSSVFKLYLLSNVYELISNYTNVGIGCPYKPVSVIFNSAEALQIIF